MRNFSNFRTLHYTTTYILKLKSVIVVVGKLTLLSENSILLSNFSVSFCSVATTWYIITKIEVIEVHPHLNFNFFFSFYSQNKFLLLLQIVRKQGHKSYFRLLLQWSNSVSLLNFKFSFRVIFLISKRSLDAWRCFT